MIKQVGNTFELVAHSAVVDGVTYLVDNKEDFERMLREQIIMTAEMDALSEGQPFDRENFQVTLPAISYTDNTLTAEQEARLVEINTYNTITLDEARDYVVDNVTPEFNSEFKIKTLTQQLEAKSLEVESLQVLNRQSLLAIAEVYEILAGMMPE